MPKLDSFAESMSGFLPADVLEAVSQSPMPSLDGGPACEDLADRLQLASASAWGAMAPESRRLAESGLWLLAGDLDRSHSISQSIESKNGSFWHGIMHRREGDFGNAKYWFRKVGTHPAFEMIERHSNGDYADPFDFVDACERAVVSSSKLAEVCKLAQWIEWQCLMMHSLGINAG